MTSRSRRKVPLGISRPWRVVGIIRFEQRGFDFSTTPSTVTSLFALACSLAFQQPINVHLSFTRLIRSRYSTRVLHTYKTSKNVLGFAVEDPGQVRETLLFLLLSTRFSYSRCIIFHSSDRNELSRDAWWLRILKESACIRVDNEQHVFARSSNVIVARVSERVSYRHHFVSISRPSMKIRIEKSRTRNLGTLGETLYIHGSIQRTSFVSLEDSWIFSFPVRSPCITPSSRIFVALSSFAFVERYL